MIGRLGATVEWRTPRSTRKARTLSPIIQRRPRRISTVGLASSLVLGLAPARAWSHPHPEGAGEDHAEQERRIDAPEPSSNEGSPHGAELGEAEATARHDDDADDGEASDHSTAPGDDELASAGDDDGSRMGDDELMSAGDDDASRVGDDEPTTEDDEGSIVPSEGADGEPTPPTAAEILAQTGADASWSPAPRMRTMSREGVTDPFPDQPPRARPRDAVILYGLGIGSAVGAALAARYTLLPDCKDQDDLGTCVVPTTAEIGLRSGRLVGTIGFSVGATAFGAFGGRELGRLLQQSDRLPLEQRRRIAVGLGTSSLVVGLGGMVAGATALGLGTRRGLRIADSFGDTITGTDEELAQIDSALQEVKVARVGLMVLAASPVLLASGISLLIHRPKRSRLRVDPMAGRGQVGLSATLRF